MTFVGVDNPYGVALTPVSYPMADLHNKKAVRKVRRQLRAPKPLSHTIKKFLLS